MRRLLHVAVVGLALGTNVGCFLPTYSADPARRTEQLIYTSEDLKAFIEEWERIWFRDQPSHLRPMRIHGGII